MFQLQLLIWDKYLEFSLSANQYNHFVSPTFVLLAYIPSRTFHTCRCVDCSCACVFISSLLVTLFNEWSWLYLTQPNPGTKKTIKKNTICPGLATIRQGRYKGIGPRLEITSPYHYMNTEIKLFSHEHTKFYFIWFSKVLKHVKVGKK